MTCRSRPEPKTSDEVALDMAVKAVFRAFNESPRAWFDNEPRDHHALARVREALEQLVIETKAGN